jgi:hypothetical protein
MVFQVTSRTGRIELTAVSSMEEGVYELPEGTQMQRMW